MDPDAKLSGRMIVAILMIAALFGGPAFYMTETQTGPAAWLIAQQVRLFGVFFSKSTFLIVMLLEMLAVGGGVLIVAVAVRQVTGRTLAEWLRCERREQ
jgi:hypothetical protein